MAYYSDLHVEELGPLTNKNDHQTSLMFAHKRFQLVKKSLSTSKYGDTMPGNEAMETHVYTLRHATLIASVPRLPHPQFSSVSS